MTERDHPDHAEDTRDDEDVELTWPWSFILLIVAGALYLILRLFEFVVKLTK